MALTKQTKLRASQVKTKRVSSVSEFKSRSDIRSLEGHSIYFEDRECSFKVVKTDDAPSSGNDITVILSDEHPDFCGVIELEGSATSVNFGCVCDADDETGTGTDDTINNQVGADYCRDNNLVYLVNPNILVSSFIVPSGLVMQSLSKGAQEYNFVQKIDSDETFIDLSGSSFINKKYRTKIDGIRAKGFLVSGTLGFNCADSSFIDIIWMEVLGFDKGYSVRQLNDSTIGYLISRNCNHAGEFIAGDAGGALDDNTNNVIVDQLLAETYYISGLDIRGLGSGASRNNKVSIQRIKCESAQLSEDATFGLKMEYLGTSSISIADSVTVNTVPPDGFQHFEMNNCDTTNIEILELRSQTNQTFDDLAKLGNNRGCYTGVSHFVGGAITNQVVTDSGGNVGSTIRLINDVNSSGSTFTNADVNSGLSVFENYNVFRSNMKMRSAGEIYHEIERTGVANWRIGRIDGSGNIRVFEGNNLILTITASGNIVTQSGDLSVISAGRGLLVRSPDGLTTRRIGIDNNGDLLITPP